MEKYKINFNNITNLNYSNINQNNNHYNEISNNEIFNPNILIYGDDDFDILKKDSKINNKLEFERVINRTKKNFLSLSEKSMSIINSKSFSLKSIITNNYNIKPTIPSEKKEKIDSKSISSSNNSLQNIININDGINGNNELSKTNNTNGGNNFTAYEPMNNKYNFTSSIFKQSSIENSQEKMIGKKRKSEKNNKNEKIEIEKKNIFNDILIICNEISNFNNEIIKREEQSNFINENENIETTIIINNHRFATIYLNGDVVNKIYIFKSDKNFIKENEILTQLKNIKKIMNTILNKLKKRIVKEN